MAKEERASISEDLGPDQEDPTGFSQLKGAIIIGAIIAAISIIFLYLLSAKTSAEFGFVQVLYSLILGLIVMFFLHWITLFMRKNSYLALIIGIAALAACIYALFVKYKGPYTTIFAIISSLVVIVYLFTHFYKSKKIN